VAEKDKKRVSSFVKEDVVKEEEELERLEKRWLN